MTALAYRRVLLVRLTSLGDVVRATGIVGALRRTLPKVEIVAVTNRALAPVFAAAPGIDHLITDSGAPRLFSVWRDARRQLRPLRGDGGFDLAVDLQGTRASAAWVYASGAERMAGRGKWRPGWQFVHSEDHLVSDVIESARIFERLGIPIGDASPVLVDRSTDEASLNVLLGKERLPSSGFLVINPFSRWPSKTWPAERYVRLLPRLRADFGLPLIIVGGPSETAMAASLISNMEPHTAVSLTGRLSLGELICLLRRARLVLTGDSGPMHVAAAVRTPVVALFGPTWPERSGPWGHGHLVLQRWRSASHHAYRDPASAVAMAAIEVEDVHAAVAAQLGLSDPHASVQNAALR